MPLLDSFKVDHTIMNAPAVRIGKTMNGPKGDVITVFDLRFYKPNHEMMSGRGIHTLEHLFAGFMRDNLNSDEVEIIDISPMGCRTGFYMCLLGTPSEQQVAEAWEKSMHDIIDKVQTESDIPELNVYQCGSFEYHSLEQARSIAQHVLDNGIGVNYNADLKLPEHLGL